MIKLESISKSYKSFVRDPGLVNALKSLFHRKYENTLAVDSASFSIEAGEFVGFLGPNGAGKTTTLKMLCGILEPSHGSIDVAGYNPFDRKKDFLKQISFVSSQKNQLWWDIPALDSLKINQAIYEIEKNKFESRLDELANLFKVQDLLNRPVRHLSLGQRMKLEIIASLIHDPKILLLDEPTIGLDFISREEIRNFLKSYQKSKNTTILLTSHYLEDIHNLCDRIILINKGNILLDTSLQSLLNQYVNKKVIKISLGENSKIFSDLKENEINRDEESVYYLINRESLHKLITDFPEATFEIINVNLEAILKTYYSR